MGQKNHETRKINAILKPGFEINLNMMLEWLNEEMPQYAEITMQKPIAINRPFWENWYKHIKDNERAYEPTLEYMTRGKVCILEITISNPKKLEEFISLMRGKIGNTNSDKAHEDSFRYLFGEGFENAIHFPDSGERSQEEEILLQHYKTAA